MSPESAPSTIGMIVSITAAQLFPLASLPPCRQLGWGRGWRAWAGWGGMGRDGAGWGGMGQGHVHNTMDNL
jgi:hypothetical protein